MKIISLIGFLSLIVPISLSSIIKIDDVEIPIHLDLDRSDILTSGVINIDLENGINIEKRQIDNNFFNSMFGSKNNGKDKDNNFGNDNFSQGNNDNDLNNSSGNDSNNNNNNNNGSDNNNGNNSGDMNNGSNNNNNFNDNINNPNNGNMNNNNNGNNNNNSNDNNNNNNNNMNNGIMNNGNSDNNNNNINDPNFNNPLGNNEPIQNVTQPVQPTFTTQPPAITQSYPTSSPSPTLNSNNGTIVEGGKKEKTNLLSPQFIVVYCVLGGIGVIILLLTISALFKSIRRKHSSKGFNAGFNNQFENDAYYEGGGYFGYQTNVTQPRPTYDYDTRRPAYNQYEMEYGNGGAYTNQVYDNQAYQQDYGTMQYQNQNYGAVQYQDQNYGTLNYQPQPQQPQQGYANY
ncbi:hypothetical protein BCR36DRAFT_583781 [Piromyces finnis]|uniref:Mid2 domain-containing protein n=1 Tax=Piromyces finnis TaxID=1754191 RepID=A0A1Y1V8E6_9FUNG|nr:hypothetical protein BCR36DRAFT_583781 [Piromyces finnis]|eukprot:ORX49727.1 hypothetical protein BCR36DRAFT_583781 [Piromyces finnis]